jgi:hypothetical protein
LNEVEGMSKRLRPLGFDGRPVTGKMRALGNAKPAAWKTV